MITPQEAAQALLTGGNRKVVRFSEGVAEYAVIIGVGGGRIAVRFNADLRLERVLPTELHFVLFAEDAAKLGLEEETALVVVSGLSDEEKSKVYDAVRVLNERLDSSPSD